MVRKVKFSYIFLIEILMILLIPLKCFAVDSMGIDGYFDEWNGIGKTVLSYYMPDPSQRSYVSAIVQDGYIKFYVETSDYFSGQIPYLYMDISVGKKSVGLRLQYTDAYGNIDYGKNNLLYNMPQGINTGLNVLTNNHPVYNLGDAAVFIGKYGEHDKMEFDMKINVLEKALHLPKNSIENGARVELRLPALGNQTVVLVGTPTGPILSVIILLSMIFVLPKILTRVKKG